MVWTVSEKRSRRSLFTTSRSTGSDLQNRLDDAAVKSITTGDSSLGNGKPDADDTRRLAAFVGRRSCTRGFRTFNPFASLVGARFRRPMRDHSQWAAEIAAKRDTAASPRILDV